MSYESNYYHKTWFRRQIWITGLKSILLCAFTCRYQNEHFQQNIQLKLKSIQLTPPLAKAMAMIATASMTDERGFHINPKNFKTLLSCTETKSGSRNQ